MLIIKKEALDAAVTAVKREAQAVAAVQSCVTGEDFARAAAIIAAAPRVMTCASGTSGIAAKKFAHSLCCIEISAAFIPPSEAVHGGLGMLKKGDALVMVSRGGKTSELLPVLDGALAKGVSVIAVTANENSPLAESAAAVLKMSVTREADPLNAMATSSFAETIAIFDALLCALIVETDYTAEQFAAIHPGGAVGERLNKDGKK